MNSGSEINRLLDLVLEKSFKFGDFTLSSGLKSAYYFDGRLTTLDPEGAYLVGKMVFELARNAGVEAIGGPTIGADPMIAGAALFSFLERNPMPAFIVRNEPKKHGMRNHIEGHLPAGSKVAIVDDVITTGGSIFRSIKAVEAEGCSVAKVIVLLDRNQGGADELKKLGYDFSALLSADAAGKVTPG